MNRIPHKSLTKSQELNKGDALKLGTYRKDTSNVELLAPVVNLTQGKSKGRFAWWIGDEGTKARVDLARPDGANPTDRERLARAQSPLEYGLDRIDATWSGFAPGGTINKKSLVSVSTAALAANKTTIPAEYFNDITTGGYGLPSNVVDGGMKADLSLIFDKTQKTKKFALTYFGANPPTTSSHNGANIEMFAAAKDSKKFFLSDTLSKNGTVAVGPNWGVLWNYASLWRSVSNQQIPLVGAYPVPWSDLRLRDWKPYTNHNVDTYQNDLQHTNSSVAPVISTLQMGFRLKSQLVSSDPKTGKQYKAQVEIKPLLGIWNPYNVVIKAAPYRFDWALYPYFRFNYAKPSGNGKYTDGRLTTLWLRKEWTQGGSDIATDVDQTGGRYFSMETTAVDIQPGEFRLFSITAPVDLKSQKTHKLEPAWSEKGAFVVDLTYKSKNDKGEEVYAVRTVPSGYRAWFGDIILEDVLSNDFDKEFPASASAKNKASSTWFTLKSGNNVLFRTTDLWNGEKTAKIMVPEPVVSGSSGGLDTKKETHLIDDIAGEKYVPHIATWSFFNRTTTQLLDKAAKQRLRVWVDSNPRAMVTKPVWDGSKADQSGRKGWHFTSHLMGASHDPAPKGQVGDGNNGWPNRGLIGEGGKAEPEPQVSDAKRYAGFGGASNTPTGQTNVIVYDVPRSPLISIGQFQHAQLSRYNFEPGFIVGNSYANPRIPLNNIVAPNFAGNSGVNVVDTSYEVNTKLWDKYFFSTLGLDYTNASGSSFDKAFDFKKLVSGEKPLPNPRMQFAPLPGETSIDKILADKTNADRAPEAIAARILVKGAFNVNSTSKTAWKAFLSTMGASQLPTISQSGTSWTKLSWNDPKGIRFNRFGHVLSADGYEKGGSGGDPEFWRGWRKLSETELDALATEIVKEVKERGPFRSLAEFVNRNPYGSNVEHQRKGGLQAALDRTVNARPAQGSSAIPPSSRRANISRKPSPGKTKPSAAPPT